MQSADLFAGAEHAPSIEQHHLNLPPGQRALEAITRVLRKGYVPQLQFSSGKDSSSLVNLALTAGMRLVEAGEACPPMYLVNIDTGAESPVVRALAESEMAKVRQFAKAHGLVVHTIVARPTLSASFAPRVIGGRALPSFPNNTSDCSVSWKVIPSERATRRIRKALAAEGRQLVTFIGTRRSESTMRLANTMDRGEAAHDLWTGPTGDLRLSPILDWSDDDVWEYLGESAAGLHPAYSDFEDLREFYADASATSCVVIADMRAQSKPCGARSGCWACVRVKSDRSVENLIEQNPDRYRYLLPLLEFRNYLVATQWDFSLRNFVGRTIDEHGCIKIRADHYSPQMCMDLLRYLLAAQDKANQLGAPAPVRTITAREVVAIDFNWACRASHPPFSAIKAYMEHLRGDWRFAPTVQRPHPPSAPPVLGEVHVGSGWDEGAHPMRPSGLRDPLWEMHSDTCGPSLKQGSDGALFLDLEEGPEFDVDEEAAELFLEFEAQRMIDAYHDSPDWTVAASVYLRMGTVQLAKGQSAGVDSMIRRSQWLQRQDLHGTRSVTELRARCTTRVAQQESLFA